MKDIAQFKRPITSIDDTSVTKITNALNKLLANEFGLFTKTLNYHWNISGPRFHSLHSFLEVQYRDLLEVMDDIAERVKILGETPHSTVQKFAETMSLNEMNGNEMHSQEMLHDLFKDNIKIQAFIKESLTMKRFFENDPGTEDFLISLLQKHEKMSWMLKSHLE